MQPDMPQNADGQSAPAKPSTLMATIALVLGVLGLCFLPVALVGGALGIIFLVKRNKQPTKDGQVMAIIAICCAGLSFVTTGILAAIAVPAFIGYVRRSKTAEATTNAHLIQQGVTRYYEQNGQLPPAIPLTPAAPPGDVKDPWPTDAPSGWQDVGFAPNDLLYYAYEYSPSPDGQRYSVRALGDLDADGVLSTFELTGEVVDGQLQAGNGFHIVNETE